MLATLNNPAEMIEHGAPHIIHSDKELAVYTDVLFHLTEKTQTTPSEDEAIDLLTLLIEKYEKERYPIPEAEPLEVLRLLMESHGYRQKDLADIFGGEGNVSHIFSGRRELNRSHIARLSERFHVSPAAFF